MHISNIQYKDSTAATRTTGDLNTFSCSNYQLLELDFCCSSVPSTFYYDAVRIQQVVMYSLVLKFQRHTVPIGA